MTVSGQRGEDHHRKGPPPTAEQITRLARALEDSGLGPEFARWQQQDTEVWAAVAGEMDAHAGDGAR